MIKNILYIFISIFESLIRNISGSIGIKIRYFYYKKRFNYCGKNVVIAENVYFDGLKFISIDDNTYIDRNVILSAGIINLKGYKVRKTINKNFKNKEGELFIGKNVHIAQNCIIQAYAGLYFGNNGAMSAGSKIYTLINSPTNSSDLSDVIYFTNRSINSAYFISPVIIYDNVGISLHSIVLPGSTIEKNSFISPNSIVMTKIKENSFASGNPAKKIKERFQNYGEKN